MFAAFDITFCSNRSCPHAKGKEGCGRSITNFTGRHLLLWESGFTPNADGSCRMYMEPEDWESRIEPWMEKLAQDIEERYAVEQARRAEALDANSLDAEDVDNPEQLEFDFGQF